MFLALKIHNTFYCSYKKEIKMRLGIIILISFVLGFNTYFSFANNISVSNVSIETKNTIRDWVYIEFDLSGQNSWRTNSGANNWNTIWVFVKFRIGPGDWQHATLSTNYNDHIMPTDIAVDAVSNGTGIFIFSSVENLGNINNFDLLDIRVRWDYGLNSVPDDATNIEVRVFGIEMVYIPQGSFYVGTGGTENNHFYIYPDIDVAYQINSENEILVGTQTNYMYYNSDDGDWDDGGDQEGPVPSSFPKGYDAFYMMRYEISQEQYMDFLNLLTREQQNARTSSNILGTDVTNTYVMSNSSSMQSRNGIRCNSSGHGTSEAIIFYCDLNGNGIGNEIDDGQNVACNYLSWNDGLAYLDWVGLRPMTELEFEKACRGTGIPTADEYAWGTTDITQVGSLLNSGQANEVVNNSGDGLCNYNQALDLPLRCGFAATSFTNRVQSSSGYYGLQDLSGNLSERCVSVASSAGRAYTGVHGDGSVDVNGDADVVNWRGSQAYSDRGGSFYGNEMRARVSDRSRAALNDNSRFNNAGWRGVRTAQ